MNKQPILSLCIPTNGAVEWILPVIDSIYSQGYDNEKFEVVITDNGKESKFFNWPYTIYYGSEIAETFQKFNVTKRLLYIRLYAVRGRNTISTKLMPCEKDSIVEDSFWWGEETKE